MNSFQLVLVHLALPCSVARRRLAPGAGWRGERTSTFFIIDGYGCDYAHAHYTEQLGIILSRIFTDRSVITTICFIFDLRQVSHLFSSMYDGVSCGLLPAIFIIMFIPPSQSFIIISVQCTYENTRTANVVIISSLFVIY